MSAARDGNAAAVASSSNRKLPASVDGAGRAGHCAGDIGIHAHTELSASRGGASDIDDIPNDIPNAGKDKGSIQRRRPQRKLQLELQLELNQCGQLTLLLVMMMLMLC